MNEQSKRGSITWLGINSALFYGIRKSATLLFQRVVFTIFIFLFGTLLSGEFGVKKPTIRLEASREHFGIFWKGLSSAREPFENAASMTWMPNKKIQGAGCANMCAIPWKPNCIEKVSKNGILVLFHNRYRYTIYGIALY